ncbi:hypothetical protein LX97_00197 [Nonlabens dokdonensis]|jgi:hypothetical protein|uniref:SbsA Ig-like domain-containing protein n=2 Tax=Nonlabens dokdonensis TaxID=328515 RepID=L7W6S9_NONDD|nr:DUF6452 family protein [Nonlabens dokdonensis]AGC75501.1 hypothetical protein DDD_0374 [Nonlabens dokdonensis DSW-6]PZX43197.1 hypothetical protein LX97_00197 [Nonlabens dokdonensis]
MKGYLKIVLLLVLALLSGSCEKDDLCTPDQAVTPRLVIEFKDALNPLEDKAVDRIQVQEIGSTDFAPIDSDDTLVLTNATTISIPLRTNSSTTSYNFILTEDNEVNSDNINFNYTLSEEYVSRSCGFRIVYNNLIAVQTPEAAVTRWIDRVLILEDDITNNTDVHVQILH